MAGSNIKSALKMPGFQLNNFQDSASGLSDKEFADVTLACEVRTQVLLLFFVYGKTSCSKMDEFQQKSQ